MNPFRELEHYAWVTGEPLTYFAKGSHLVPFAFPKLLLFENRWEWGWEMRVRQQFRKREWWLQAKVISPGNGEKLVDSRDIWEVKTIGLGDFLDVKNEEEGRRQLNV